MRNPWTLRCAQAGCDELASHIAMQAHELALLFKGGAAVCCTKHAGEYETFGALTVPINDFVDLAERTTA